jgi:ferric iron reductase protein FhuF
VTDLAGAWRAATEIGPYFATELDASDAAWIELSVLVDDPTVLRERVAAARSLIAERCRVPAIEIDLRAVASIQFLGVAARLVSPSLAVAVLTRVVPELTMAGVHWQRVEGGPIPMAVSAQSCSVSESDDGLADLVYDGVIATCVTPLAEAVQREFRLSSKVVWGNVASALGGAANMLGAARPDLAGRATNLADRLLHKGHLVGTGRYVWPDASGPHFVRDNCCLFYRIPGGGKCADCVLLTR